MAKIEWGLPQDRLFSAGLDRGVLYVDPVGAVPWNGLISVKESISGGDLVEQYVDGVLTLQYTEAERSTFDLEAFYSPEEFDACDGTVTTGVDGIYARNQIRQEFGLCYRSYVGDSVEGVEADYLIHLIYNCLAHPSGTSSSTIGENVDPNSLSWTISTRPFSVNGLVPTSHYILDSRVLTAAQLESLEGILYGTEAANPRLLTEEELINYLIYISGQAPTWVDDTTNGGGSWTTIPVLGLSYSPESGTAESGESVTVYAIADPGYTISGTSSWTHTFPSAP